VVSIVQNSKELILSMRNGAGPAILELVTYRWYGHVDWREDIDVGVARSMEDIKNWKARDPIHRLSQSMIHSKIWTKEEENELSNKIDTEIQIAWDKAMNDPYPSKDSILKFVYSNN
jgi:pyruvate dehydrogenase E1 component alpha subunit